MPTAINVNENLRLDGASHQRLRAVMMRSGTSKGLFFRREDLPSNREDWAPLILAAMGSPDPYSRQLDGMGGGTSTQSKVAVIGRCDNPSIADIDYTFIQVSINKAMVDYSGNCGNMVSWGNNVKYIWCMRLIFNPYTMSNRQPDVDRSPLCRSTRHSSGKVIPADWVTASSEGLFDMPNSPVKGSVTVRIRK